VTDINNIDFNQAQAVLIEASAGTGKTWALERLFIKALLQQPHLKLAQFLVVTFTKLATAELKDRIRRQIELTIDDFICYQKTKDITQIKDNFNQELIKSRCDYLDKDIAHLVIILNNFDSAKIITIHGFCNYVLNNYQIDSNLAIMPNMIVDNIDHILELLVRRFILIKLFNNKIFINQTKNIVILLQTIFIANNIDDVVKQIVKKINSFILYIDGKFRLQYKVLDNYDLSNLLIDEITTAEKELIFLSALLTYVETDYNRVANNQNIITQNDLVSIVAYLVANNDSLCDKLYQQLPVVFIDEFQDTDIYQWRIFNSIYHIDKKVRGNITIVGDPKQAIYSFRGADINTYIFAKSMIKSTVRLTDNYRSHPDIIKFINCLFDSANIKDKLGYGIDYQIINAKYDINKLISMPLASQITNRLYQITQSNIAFSDKKVQIIPNKNKDSVIKSLVFEVLALLNTDPDLIDKIAVLVYKKDDAVSIMHQLNKHGVRAITNIGTNIFATDTAQDLYNLLLSIADLSNIKNLKLALSSNLFSLPYQQLLDGNYGGIIDLLFKYKKIINSGNIIYFIYQLIEDLSNLYQSNQMVLVENNVNELLHLAEILNKKYNIDKNLATLLYWFKTKLDLLTVKNEDLIEDDNELIRLNNHNKQIVIMTEHKSKGLEFDIVFCPFFVGMKEYTKESTAKVTTSYYDTNNNFAPLLSCDIDLINNQKIANFAEKQRLNYVTLTRAKSRLYIYLIEHKQTKAGGLNKLQTYYPVNYLFGLDNNKQYFDYANIFNNVANAILSVELQNIVAMVDRSMVDENLLLKLALKNHRQSHQNNCAIDIKRHYLIKQYWQSYTSISHSSQTSSLEFNKPIDQDIAYIMPNYKYKFLANLAGKDFGILIHSLLEQYPYTLEQLETIIVTQKLNFTDSIEDLYSAIYDMLNYKIYHNQSILDLAEKKSELNFNLAIKNDNININAIAQLIAKYYGIDHPYTMAIKNIKKIEHGFLTGAIDLIFQLDGKYYIVDYKTNTLNDYSSCENCYVANQYNNPLLQVNAKKHYYLQYLIYLVALKRYLELKLNISDASHLIGGAIYYYVRASCIIDVTSVSGIYVDDQSQVLIHELDLLLKGV
jgi:exodeoxyribonuclease V beta subunit